MRGDRTLLHHATWRLGPGDRVGIVGVNGAGKTSVLRLLAGVDRAVGRARTSRPHRRAAAPDPGPRRPRPGGAGAADAGDRGGSPRTEAGEITATSLLERFGFTGDRLTTRIGDLSGGERRRFQLLRLLMTEPNMLLLDEPTNDLDIDTLNVLEDFLDGWPGTLVVVSHDRYFLERVTDSVVGAAGGRPDLDAAGRRRRVPPSAGGRPRGRRR